MPRKAWFFIIQILFFLAVRHAHAQNTAVPWSGFAVGTGIVTGSNTFSAASVGEGFTGAAKAVEFQVGSGFLAGLASQSGITSVQDEQALPLTFELYQNYPNPFNPSTTITYDIPELSRVTIRLFNLLGQLVATITDGEQPPGQYRIVWKGQNDTGVQVSSGVYFYRIHARKTVGDRKEFIQTKKLVLLK
ncbi:MAG: T9SS type A sorting domain-containing protein [Ignavibacteriales bacterium]|nr:T9SS type A sorting domain-containing protein [Ignavibacteriales bacterium]